MRSPEVREESGKAQDKSATAQDCKRQRKFRVPRFVADNQAVSGDMCRAILMDWI